MQTVAIIGVGLIGGSFGLALRKAGFAGEILGVSSPAAIETGIAVRAISRGTTLEEAAETADLIYLAQPVDRILKTLESLGRMARKECLITDAGSTKGAIVQKALECVISAEFLGGHPLAGKEQRGAEWGDADLFRARPYVLTPAGARTAAAESFRLWLVRMGAQLIDLTPAEHDAVVALSSHLPQLVASALANTLASQKNANVKQVFGPGLLDMTRLALSSSELWESIFATNQTEILRAVDAFMKSVGTLRDAVARGDLREPFRPGASFARELRNVPCAS